MNQPRSALYVLDAYGITNPWVVWSIHTGNLTELCKGCRGLGRILLRPCVCAEDSSAGCNRCRVRCPDCAGRRTSRDKVYAEDFGDAESRAIAMRLFDVEPDPRMRSDMEAAVLQ